MRPLASFLDATAFLTRVPVPVRWPGSARRAFDLAAAAWAFPVVGALLGLVLGGVGVLLAGPLGVLAAAVVVVALEVVLTGALHLDGLADCADGCGGRDWESRLRIMKDHASGVYGVAAVVLVLLLQVALLARLLEAGLAEADAVGLEVVEMAVVVAMALALSRGLLLPLAAALPYARAEGTGRALVEGLTRGRVVAGVVSTVVVLALLTAVGWWLMGPGAVVLVLAVLGTGSVTVLLVGLWARHTLGGVTGDVLGAAAELSVVAALAAATVLRG
ncbi:adenosylcobinamide-GDP ribazoletransferase [Ornithinimicrobium panacihumi]|uniref:adenosylcobinamide-GDP ribazoletransferase n=1 Tax=Ornithinimicrobium panacihumi TaxID=2008449 RepID=UPI003F888510